VRTIKLFHPQFERRTEMRKMAVTLAIVFLVVSGCSTVRTAVRSRRQLNVPKSFYDRTITYQVDADARRYMSNLENLFGYVKQQQAPFSEELMLSLYRDTDIDRNRHITALEAEAYYNDCVLRFEDSLGPVQFP
jgi:uncharacterized protein YceK